MTSQEAIQCARDCIHEAAIETTGVEGARKYSSRDLPQSIADHGDVWIVRFSFAQQPNVVASVEGVAVLVQDATGETRILTGM